MIDELKWGLLDEVSGRLEAEMIKSLLEAEGIPTELIQEAVGHLIYPVTVDGLGRVQIFVPCKDMKEASLWLKAYFEGLPTEDDK